MKIMLPLAAMLSVSTLSAQTAIEFSNPGTSKCRAGDATPCASPDNRVQFSVITQAPDPAPPPPSAIVPRFEAFWITGDGNYWDFPGLDDDAESLAPGTTYNYGKAGTYTVSAYLTGKYTDHNPPPGAARAVTVGNPDGTRNTTPTAFRKRAGSGDYDFFTMHQLRKNYLTASVVSYPASLDSTWCYLFFNGRPNGSPWPEQPLKYKKTEGEIASYYSGDKNRIVSYNAGDLATGFDGTSFTASFANMSNHFSNVLYFPLENTRSANLTPGFTQKRYFPVFWADSSQSISVVAPDTVMRFCVIITGPKPLSQGDGSKISGQLEQMGFGSLNAFNPINVLGNSSSKNSEGIKLQSPNTVGVYQYIQGFYTGNIEYVQAHDPNQLTVLKIVEQSPGKYLVTFHLEMCNKGTGNTNSQTVELFDRFGHFHDFTFNGAPIPGMSGQPNHYSFGTHLAIAGIPQGEYEMRCESVEFTAVTDCNGIQALWKGHNKQALGVCVKFTEATGTECGENVPIDSCDFKIDGKCPCVQEGNNRTGTCGGGDWMLVFVLILVFAILIWNYLNNKD